MLNLGWHLQRLLRDYGYVKGYVGEVVILTFFVLYFTGNIKEFIVEPIVNLRVNTSDYKCSANMQHFLWIVQDIYTAVIPLAFQVIFLAVMWRLANIQDDGESIESLT